MIPYQYQYLLHTLTPKTGKFVVAQLDFFFFPLEWNYGRKDGHKERLKEKTQWTKEQRGKKEWMNEENKDKGDN